MEQDKWIQQLRDKLDGFEADVPEGLWENIEAALQEQGVLPPSGPRRTRQSRFIALRRWAVAASVVACLVGGGYWWWSRRDLPQDPVVRETIAHRHEVDSSLDSAQSPDGTAVTENTMTAMKTKTKSMAVAAMTSPKPSCESDPPSLSCESEPEMVPSQPSNKGEVEVPIDEVILLAEEESHELAQLTPRSGRRPYVSVYSDNGVNDYMNSNGVEMSEQKANRYYALSSSDAQATRGRDIIYLASYEERQRHDRPISVGLSVSYPLSDRFFVTSGAVVIWLHSEFENIIRNQTITRNQRLVYFGIPLSMNYRIWQYKGLKLYALAGGQADWNVSAETDTDGVEQEISKDRMQWSVHASAGLEFCPIPQLGLYVEPGMKYYFDNGSKVSNYFKDKPLNFNLQFGLRFNLNSAPK